MGFVHVSDLDTAHGATDDYQRQKKENIADENVTDSCLHSTPFKFVRTQILCQFRLNSGKGHKGVNLAGEFHCRSTWDELQIA